MKYLFYVFFFIVFVSFLSATIINVPADQPTIQEGINVAVDNDTVLVQPGTYIENINYNGKNITVASLFLTTQDTTLISLTIIDGNESGSVVMFESEEDSTAVLTGFTITNGLASGYVPECCGGGIYCEYSSPSLLNVTITDNSAGGYGGGIYCNNASPNLTNLTITGNSAIQGSGIYCEESDPFLVNVNIINNSTGCMYGNAGGGIFCWDSSPSLENVTISGNTSYVGAGIYCAVESNLSLINVTISGNSIPLEGGPGGGIYCGGSSPSLVNVTISGNFADGYGGGILCDNSSPTLENVTISGNTSFAGGGICCGYSSPSLENVIITDNSAEYCGGGIYCLANSSPSLINSILWNDTPQEVYFGVDWDPNSITISYSDIQGGEAGIVTNHNGTVNWLEGNIDEDPLFVGTGDYPYSLLEDSPCIDAGNPDPIYYDPEDPTNPGYALYPAMGTVINDMGAYGGPYAIGWSVVGLDDNIIVHTPEVFLHQNYPNPFNPETTISFSVTQTSLFVTLDVYNIKGQKVKTLVNETLPAGEHSVVWDGRDSNNKRVGSGVYFYQLKAGRFEKVKKMVLLK
jgi:predicted outer membrane repeat protein